MSASHSHAAGESSDDHVRENRQPKGGGLGRALFIGLCATLIFAAVEVVAGSLYGSLALVSDAGHMLVDSAGLILALAATMLSNRPSDVRRSYGYARIEVLVVPLHVLIMVGLAAFIVFEAVMRLGDPPSVNAGPVLVVGIIGLALNLIILRLLHGHAHSNLNARGAKLEVVADTFGSIGVIAAALIVAGTGFRQADVIISLLIGALIIPRAVELLRHSVSILLEGTPPGIDPDAIAREARLIPGVREIHDLHVWSLRPSFIALSAHVEVDQMDGAEHIIAALATLFRQNYGISHVTLQPETWALHEEIACCDFPDAIASDEHAAHAPVPAGSR